jgi:hypothetical protein
MPPCLYLRDWYESGKSSHSDQAYRLPYLPTLVSPFHPEPLQSAFLFRFRLSRTPVKLYAFRKPVSSPVS